MFRISGENAAVLRYSKERWVSDFFFSGSPPSPPPHKKRLETYFSFYKDDPFFLLEKPLTKYSRFSSFVLKPATCVLWAGSSAGRKKPPTNNNNPKPRLISADNRVAEIMSGTGRDCCVILSKHPPPRVTMGQTSRLPTGKRFIRRLARSATRI